MKCLKWIDGARGDNTRYFCLKKKSHKDRCEYNQVDNWDKKFIRNDKGQFEEKKLKKVI